MAYIHLKDGVPVKVQSRRGFVYIKHMCCDCGLVHRCIYEVSRGGLVRYTSWRDRRATAAARRRLQVKR